MKTRHDILNDVLNIYSEMEELQDKINELYQEAQSIDDQDDDKDGNDSYLNNIKSYVVR